MPANKCQIFGCQLTDLKTKNLSYYILGVFE